MSAKLNNSANSLAPSSSTTFLTGSVPIILNPSLLNESALGPGPAAKFGFELPPNPYEGLEVAN